MVSCHRNWGLHGHGPHLEHPYSPRWVSCRAAYMYRSPTEWVKTHIFVFSVVFSRLAPYPYIQVVYTNNLSRAIQRGKQMTQSGRALPCRAFHRGSWVRAGHSCCASHHPCMSCTVPLYKRFSPLSKNIVAVRRAFLFQPSEGPKPIQPESNPLCESWRLIRRIKQLPRASRSRGSSNTNKPATNGENREGGV